MFDIKGVMQQKIKPEFWNRGVIYFQSQKVGSVRVTEKEKSILFNADITGSARKIYFGEITLEKETSKITHYCDCMAHNPTSGCKHVAALALQISDTLYINDLLFVIHRHTKEILAEGLQSDGFIEGIFDSEDEDEDEIPEDISGNKLDIFSQFKQKETQNTKNDTFKYKIKLNFLESYYSHDKNDIELCLYECKPLKSGGFSSGRQIYRNAVQQAPTLFQKYTQFIEYSNSRWHSGSEHITFAESPEYFLQMLFQLEGEIVNKKNKVLHLEKEVLPLKIKTVLQKDGKYLIQLVVESQIKGEVNILKKSVFPAGKTGYFACITKNRYLYFFKSDFNNKFIQEFTQQELLLESEEFESLKQSDYFSDIIQHSSSLVDMGVEKKLGSPKGYLEVEITEDFEEVKIISGIYYTQENIITSENTKNISYFIEGKSVVERNIKKEEEVLVDLSSLLEKCEKKEGEHVKMIDGNIDNFFDMIESYIEKGYVVEYKQNTKRVSNSELGLKVDIKSGIDFFETKTSLTLGGKELEEYAEILSLLGKNKNFNKKSITLKNGMTVLLKENIEESFGLLDELGIQKEKIGENIQIGKHNIGLLHNKNKENNIAFSLDKETVELKKSLENFSGITKVAVPKNVKADLRDYQHTGYNWINFLEKYHFSGILADDMGLGKTLQTLTLLQKVYNKKTLKKQSLVVCPTSLIFNWIDEAKKFTPDLQVEYIKDSKVGFSEISKETQVIIVSYGIIANLVDKEKVPSDFYYLILDESQNIKNPVAKRTKSIGKIQSQYRLALSGTPIENNLMELWSVFNFLMPGFLGNMNHFRTKYLGKTQKEDLLNLSLKTKPFILRRTKEEVLTELPPKQEEVVKLEMGEKQKDFYMKLKTAFKLQISKELKEHGLNKARFQVLDSLLKLRQACLVPELVNMENNTLQDSIKIQYIEENIEDMIISGHNLLIFSQFTGFLQYVKNTLDTKDIQYNYLDGKTKPQERKKLVDEFNNGKKNVFIISLKAGGTGLNLTKADYVLHLDPWWNPAVENQATDRAHRMGQQKTVFVKKLITKDTIEEKILQLQEKKKKLIDDIFSGNFSGSLNKEDIDFIFE